MTSPSPPPNTRQKEGGSARAGVTAGMQHVDSISCLPPQGPWCPHKPLLFFPRPQFPWQKGSYHSVSQLERNRESSLPGGRGTAKVTSRSLLYQQISLGNGGQWCVWGNQDSLCSQEALLRFLCLTSSPPLCAAVSLLLHFCATLWTFQEPRWQS